MGQLLARLQRHQRAIALGAVVLLPLSTAAATASVAGAAPATARLPLTTRVGPQAGLALGIVPAASARQVDKVLPAGWTGPGGHTPVVVGTVRQRIAQVSATTSHDIPQAALDAYRNAQASLAASDPGCHLSWTLLAGIGQVESDNGRYGGAVVLANGDTSPHILGPVLNGTAGVGAIRDTDNGRYDGDPVWDRAVGPMQFIPGTWAGYGADGNGDGVRDPNNIADAALGAAGYLCAGGGDLRDVGDLRAAVMRYNHSDAYVDLVLRLAAAYADGAATVIPNGSAAPAAPAAPTPPAKREGFAKVPGGGRQHQGSGGSTGGGSGSGGGSGRGGHGQGGHHGGGGQAPPPIHTGPHRKPPTTTPPIIPTPVSPTKPAPITPTPTSPTPTKPHQTKPAPPTVIATGVLRSCQSGWCVGTTALDLGVDADLNQRLGDLNGDGKTRSLVRELRGLRGTMMTVQLVREPPQVTTPSAPAAPSTPTTPSMPAPITPVAPSPKDGSEDATPVIITVDADGLVTSINGIAYATPAPTLGGN